MSKKILTIEQRVDILLREGVDNPKKWSAVDSYVEPDEYDKHCVDEGYFNEVCFDVLRDHHFEETKFLLDVIRELIARVKK